MVYSTLIHFLHVASASDRKHMLCLMFNVTAVFNVVVLVGSVVGMISGIHIHATIVLLIIIIMIQHI